MLQFVWNDCMHERKNVIKRRWREREQKKYSMRKKEMSSFMFQTKNKSVKIFGSNFGRYAYYQRIFLENSCSHIKQ